MAVSFKTDQSYGLGLIALFGVTKGYIEAVKEHGILIDQSSPGTFVVSLNGHVYGTIPVKGQAISLAKAGSLGPASMQAIQFQFEQAIKLAVAGIGASVPSTPTPAGPVGSKAQDTSAMNKAQVHLATASELYQACNGTSAGSVYYVLAMFEGMNMAARVKGNQLSLRAEGPKLKSYFPALADVGFSMKDQYASVHFTTPAKELMQKTMGAVIGRTGFSNVVAVGDVTKITK